MIGFDPFRFAMDILSGGFGLAVVGLFGFALGTLFGRFIASYG